MSFNTSVLEMTSANNSFAYREKMTKILCKKNDEIACLNESVQELKSELTLKTQSNNKLKIRMEDLLNESINMESSLQEENVQLTTSINCLKSENKSLSQLITDLKDELAHLKENVNRNKLAQEVNTLRQENSRLSTLVFNLKADNNNLKKASSDLKCKLAKFSHKKSINKESSTQTVYSTVNSSKTVNSLTKVTNNKVTTKINDHFLGADVVGAARFDKFSQTAVNMRNNTAQTHTSPIVNNFEETNSTKIGNKQRVVHETRINTIQSNKSLLEELKEIYPPVQLNLDSSLGSTASKYVPKMCITRKEKHIKILTQKAKIRILILADSHGRNLVSKFRDRLSPKYSVQCIFKPNATFEQITCDLSGLTLDFNKDDQVIIITGTNNALNKNYISDHHIEKAVAALSHTNCMFAAVPYAYHYNYNYFNNLAYKTNYQFQFIVNRYCGFAKFLDVNRILNSNHKTLNGLHLNDKGILKGVNISLITVVYVAIVIMVAAVEKVKLAVMKKVGVVKSSIYSLLSMRRWPM
ncbi:hypothetical protein FQR65_LT16760 [Abscondita terminalis]|nr:hypothetical protein FQR65_LT16760 [Abscondita terminalis]